MSPQGHNESLPAMKPVAVIDIGSNTVRLVIYDGLRRTPTTVFNEKAQCELGRGLAQEGAMMKETMARAHKTLRRFRLICDRYEIDDLIVFATAAVRDASNGPDFVAKAEDIMKVKISVLTGEEEAHLTGLGVCYSFHEPTGIVCDMGGGSLEIIEARSGRVSGGHSLPIGTLRLVDSTIEQASGVTNEHLKNIPNLFDTTSDFFLVGGSWRALARVYITHKRYPIRILHQFDAPAQELRDFIDNRLLADQLSMKLHDEIPENRRATLPYSALVLRNLIDRFQPENVAISAHGVREGALFDRLKKKDRQGDPLISHCRSMTDRSRPGSSQADELEPFVRPYFDQMSGISARLAESIRLLSDIAWARHPSYRALDTFYSILHAPFIGITHRERAILALSIYYRYGGDDDDLPNHVATTLKTRDVDHAREIGALLRLAHAIKSYGPNLVNRCRLEVDMQKLTLHLTADATEMIGNGVRNRLKALGKLRRLETEVLSAD